MRKANTTSKNTTLCQLQELSFALVDLNLFLDNNPDCSEAIETYNNLFKDYWETKSLYETQYGPLTNFGYSPASYPYNWVTSPWPWEKSAN